jgi:sarcosine oxidase, subunit beta
MPASKTSGPTHRAAVVIIGGGVMGTSIAYHLARAGVTDVVLLEAGELAGGSSGKPLGGVRAMFSDPANIALGLRSLDAYRRFGSDFGVDVGLQLVGYLFAITDAADVARFEQSVALQNALGVPSRMITAGEAVELCPYLDAGLVAAAWSPNDGFARPTDVVHALAGAARDLGVSIRTGTRVLGIEDSGAGEAVLSAADGTRYAAPAVVCAAGAWSRAVGAMVDIELPVEPLRRQIVFSPPLGQPPPRIPVTIDYSSTAYFHGAPDGGLMLGWADPGQPAGFERSVTTDWHAQLRAALRGFAPQLVDLPFCRGWAGLYEMTPDCNALIGEAPSATSGAGFRFLYATGFSGHGFLQGPAVGECVKDLYLGRPPAVDIACFDVRRFRQPPVRTELGII